jgi:hypothetical protein
MAASRREEVGEQLEEASERLAEVAAELHSWVGPAARHAPSDEEAERLKRQAAAAIHDVARMLGSEGPAAAIAEVGWRQGAGVAGLAGALGAAAARCLSGFHVSSSVASLP